MDKYNLRDTDMVYRSSYRVPDTDDKGIASKDEYLLINCVGFYGFDDPWGATARKTGRCDYYLSYNHGGLIKVLSERNIYEIGPGTVFVYHPFEEQYYGQANREPLANYWVHFTGYGASEMLIKSNMASGNIFSIGVSDEIPLLFEKMLDEVADKPYNFETASASILMQIFTVISRKLMGKKKVMPVKERDALINATVSHIHKNYAGRITVAGLADIAGFSPSGYSRIFKQYTGLSPQQYLIAFRLQKAKELIRHTGLSIKQISSAVGFEDQLYFSRLFRQYENASPSEYRTACDKS